MRYLVLTFLLALTCRPATSFNCISLSSSSINNEQYRCASSPAASTVSRIARRPTTTHLNAFRDEDDGLLPDTMFGSEAVPEGQRPINEYLNLLSSPLYGWAALETSGLLTRLLIVYVAAFGAVCYPIAGATFTQDGYLLQKLTAANVGAITLELALLLRLSIGWGYVGSRLQNKFIEYEETGWYDGDFETKTVSEQKRDKFLFQSKVAPVVDRIKTFSLAGGVLLLVSVFGFKLALNAKPLFDQYDPATLERLRYDDKLAETAQREATGRPAYCDSRYYQAVAGANGCNFK